MSLSFGEKVKILRAKKGFSQQQLADLAGVQRSYITLLENRTLKGRVSMTTALSLAKALDIDPKELFETATLRTMPSGKTEKSLSGIIKELKEKYDMMETVEIPVRGSIPSVVVLPSEQKAGEFVEVPRQSLNGIAPQKLYALKISGDNLSSEGIYSGDFVIVNPADTEPEESRIYVVRLGNDFCVCHVSKGSNFLKLTSSDRVPQKIKTSDAEVLGRVILSGRWKKH